MRAAACFWIVCDYDACRSVVFKKKKKEKKKEKQTTATTKNRKKKKRKIFLNVETYPVYYIYIDIILQGKADENYSPTEAWQWQEAPQTLLNIVAGGQKYWIMTFLPFIGLVMIEENQILIRMQAISRNYVR